MKKIASASSGEYVGDYIKRVVAATVEDDVSCSFNEIDFIARRGMDVTQAYNTLHERRTAVERAVFSAHRLVIESLVGKRVTSTSSTFRPNEPNVHVICFDDGSTIEVNELSIIHTHRQS